jgi:transglutaminase-like putative cysteine protease
LILSLISILHRTEYLYHRPVRLGPHRLMLRPRESHELRLVSNEIAIQPPAILSWAQDVFGNAIATANFSVDSDRLTIESSVTLDLTSGAWPVFPIAARAISYPFSYSEEERTDLGALLEPQYLDATGRVRAWALGFVRSNPTDSLALLKDLNAGVSATASYQARENEGTQTPIRTLDLGRGCCRDFAFLFAEAARSLGFGARIVSGYLFNPGYPRGEGTTHAWTEVFVPGAGWITFDPTNRQTGGFNLIPVAVARDLGQATPVSGTFTGARDDSSGLSVSVRVTELT